MKQSHIVTIDAKGRIIVPYHMREYLALSEGSSLVVSNNEKKELRAFPMLEGMMRLSVILNDKPGALAAVADIVAKHHCDIVMSASRVIERGRTAEWTALLDATLCRNPGQLERELKSSVFVRRVAAERRPETRDDA